MPPCLLNAIYFNADWTEKFDVNDTRNSSFTLPDGSIVTRELMHRKAIAQGCESELCSMLRIPFGSGGYSMYVMLPAEGKTTGDLIRDMSQQELTDHLDAIDMTPHEVDILMPRFEIVSDIDLIKVLKPMGIQSAFTGSADFSNMSNAGLYLYVSASDIEKSISELLAESAKTVNVMGEVKETVAQQKAKIEVDEDGAKASAVTIASMGFTSPGPVQYEKAEFHATRPFLYFILEESTRSIFFIGTYCGN